MNDVENRLRAGLSATTGPVDADRMLDAVGNGVARRRRRTAIAVAAVVAVVVGSIGTVIAVRDDGSSYGPSHRPTPSPSKLPEGAYQGVIDVQVLPDDTVLRLTTNVGCVACSTVWTQDLTAKGGWKRLHEFGPEAYFGKVNAVNGPVLEFLMAPDGHNGWAWGARLFATHDGGESWSEVVTGPGQQVTDAGPQVVVTDRYAWALVRTEKATELWRSDLGSDEWAQVPAPHLDGVSGILAIGQDVALETSDEGLANPRLQYSSDGTTWNEVGNPCQGDRRIKTAQTVAYIDCIDGKTARFYRLLGDEHTGADLARWEPFGTLPWQQASDFVPLGDNAVLAAGPGTAHRLTEDGSSAVDLGSPTEAIGDISVGSGLAILTMYDEQGIHLLRSSDGGATWTALEQAEGN